MQCKKCEGKLEVARSCWRVKMRCMRCGLEYEINEVAHELDAETEEILARYPSIIYQ